MIFPYDVHSAHHPVIMGKWCKLRENTNYIYLSLLMGGVQIGNILNYPY